jgi:hypothetical protein
MPDTDAPDEATSEQTEPDSSVRDPRAGQHPTGEDQAAENADNESPA